MRATTWKANLSGAPEWRRDWRDPIRFANGPNLYCYVRQNPWTKFDPLGLLSDEVKNYYKDQDPDTITPGQIHDYYVENSTKSEHITQNEVLEIIYGNENKGVEQYFNEAPDRESARQIRSNTERFLVEVIGAEGDLSELHEVADLKASWDFILSLSRGPGKAKLPRVKPKSNRLVNYKGKPVTIGVR